MEAHKGCFNQLIFKLYILQHVHLLAQVVVFRIVMVDVALLGVILTLEVCINQLQCLLQGQDYLLEHLFLLFFLLTGLSCHHLLNLVYQ
jgi:hypothetical protein